MDKKVVVGTGQANTSLSKVAKFTVIFDNGKPNERTFTSFERMRYALKKFYGNNKANGNATVYDETDTDISENQLMAETFGEIVEEVEKEEKVEAFNKKNWQRGDLVEVYPLSHDSKIYGVNWSAVGTKGVGEVENFIKQLNEAIALCDEVNGINPVFILTPVKGGEGN